MNYIIAIGAFQAIIATILTGNNKLRKGADSLLVLLLICIGTHLAIKFVIFNLVSDMAVRYQMNTFIGYCYGPLLFLYASRIKHERYNIWSRWYLFIPFLLAMVGYLTVICVLFFSAEIGHHVLKWYNSITTYSAGSYNLACAASALYKAKTLPAVRKKEKQLIYFIGTCMVLACLTGLAASVLSAMLQLQYNLTVRSICYTLFSAICIGILRYRYMGVPQQAYIHNPPQETVLPVQQQIVIQPAGEITEEQQPVARKPQLTQEEQHNLLEKLEQYLLQSQAYKDPELTLDKLAAAIHVSRYHLSETLNVYMQKTFYQYINEWRVNSVIEQIKQLAPRELPINFLTLAYDNGFKAKSSFNLYFKKMTERTPTEFVKALQSV